ncbi:hypothetical protein LOTGIDRAFT_159395 [Lottia gigantea]|uniref:Uncharacterized protein n=1 Tax=Lottia gigantea TaxID=225164 RepID=V4A0P7_LOTGI|nr:hypothetical protein LOTGIDRAFT_159395 [Lottia gigantea]ESO97363.1 hypothetical protein LOTGIDRAFT_159395 [Lottia gigantea]
MWQVVPFQMEQLSDIMCMLKGPKHEKLHYKAEGIVATVTSVNDKKAVDDKNAEERRHNLVMEKEAWKAATTKDSGVADILGTVKEFGKRFGEETKKTVKQGLNKLIDNIDTGEMP